MILEAFAGPGGISEALRMVLPDVPALGIEKDPDACATAEAAGHERLQADVSMLDLRPYVGRVVGFCAGPPCQSFSAAGRQLGKLDKPRIVAHIERIRRAGRWLHYSREGWHDPRSPLVLEVLRYALTLRPEWVVLEQVPAVLPLWELVADVLRDQAWHVEARVLQAEQYGVPQTRKRAILAARMCLPGCPREPSVCVRSRGLLPAPTHRPYRKGIPREAGDQSLLPWVSMADALGCAIDWLPSAQARNAGPGAQRDPRGLGDPSYTIRAQGSGSHPSGVEWVAESPRRVRVSVQEAAVLQSFRPDYPWRGSMSAQYRQVGDSAPPVLIAAVISSLTKR